MIYLFKAKKNVDMQYLREEYFTIACRATVKKQPSKPHKVGASILSKGDPGQHEKESELRSEVNMKKIKKQSASLAPLPSLDSYETLRPGKRKIQGSLLYSKPLIKHQELQKFDHFCMKEK